MKKWLFLASLSVLLAACGTTGTPGEEETPEEIVAGDSVVGVAAEAGLSAFVEALQEASLDDDFASGGPYTLFAPTNAAFSAADSAAEDLLEYHIVEGSYTLDELESGSYETVSGRRPRSVRSRGQRELEQRRGERRHAERSGGVKRRRSRTRRRADPARAGGGT